MPDGAVLLLFVCFLFSFWGSWFFGNRCRFSLLDRRGLLVLYSRRFLMLDGGRIRLFDGGRFLVLDSRWLLLFERGGPFGLFLFHYLQSPKLGIKDAEITLLPLLDCSMDQTLFGIRSAAQGMFSLTRRGGGNGI